MLLCQGKNKLFFSVVECGQMPALTHPKYEAYAIHRAGGCSKTEAAKRAGFSVKGAPNEGSRLERRPEIAARVSELSQLPENKANGEPGSALEKFIGLPSVISEVVGIHKDARAGGQLSVALACQQYLGKLGRLTPDANPNPSPRMLTQNNFLTMTAKDLNAYLRDQVKALPAIERKAVEDIIDIESLADESIDELL
tara:strand:+ start:62 stop:652 length:591 start_codon:yes stop_codon:yes gene_type:complete